MCSNQDAKIQMHYVMHFGVIIGNIGFLFTQLMVYVFKEWQSQENSQEVHKNCNDDVYRHYDHLLIVSDALGTDGVGVSFLLAAAPEDNRHG